jgi:hypothetical protein
METVVENEIKTASAATAEEKKGSAYNAKEQELIRQLVQARLEQKEDLPFENLDGYELPPRTQFSMLKKPAVSIKYGRFTCNMACIRLFEGVQHILPIVNREKKRLAIVTCAEEESASVEWARLKQDSWVNKDITSLEFIKKIFDLMGWDEHCRYKALGRIAASPKGLILVFDLEESIMFTPTPVEYVDKSTGEVKKRQVKYYPDEYKDCIGKSYNDYAASQQLNLFEAFDGYATQSGSGENPENSPISTVAQEQLRATYSGGNGGGL